MRSRTAKLFLLTTLVVSIPLSAQESGVIDLFEGQNELPATRIEVQGADGAPVDVDDDGDYSGSLDGGFTLKFEKNAGAILVPATINGKKAYFIFDTGATITTLTSDFARAVGALPPKGAPQIVTQTANGQRDAEIGLINTLVLGGRPHGGVSYTVCDECPSGPYRGGQIVGLLGMNVLGRYRTSFDHGKGEIEMSPSSTYADQWSDIQPWVRVTLGELLPYRGRNDWTLVGTLKNAAPRAIKEIRLRYSCQGSKPGEAKEQVAARKSKKFELVIKGGNCPEGFAGEVVGARW